MGEVIDIAAKTILNSRGKDALSAWAQAVENLGKDIMLVKLLHQKVGSHLADQISETYHSEEK